VSAGRAVRAALGLGSNMGDSRANLDRALAELSATPGIEVLARSADYRTPPWGPVPQDDFRNTCAVIETMLSPRALLDRCLEVEQQIGRVRDVRWGPRLIDIDVLLYGTARVEEDGLSIPHPRMGERAFVLVPLADIWPDAPLGDGRTVAEALAECPGCEEIVKLP
jgi:2-amino-4-hydroxy-6-hydroxymethyldihydropteridine diphosphokinase